MGLQMTWKWANILPQLQAALEQGSPPPRGAEPLRKVEQALSTGSLLPQGRRRGHRWSTRAFDQRPGTHQTS